MEERELVRLAKDGDEESFSDLVKVYQSKVFSMALNFTGNREAADDLAQEIFIKAYLGLPKFRFQSEFGTWLYRVSLNHIRDFLRRKGRTKEVSLDDTGSIPAPEEDSPEAGEEGARQERRRRLVREVLGCLPEKYRVILTLRDIQGMAYEEIARVLNLSPGTVDSRLFRARQLLRKKMTPFLDREGGRDAV